MRNRHAAGLRTGADKGRAKRAAEIGRLAAAEETHRKADQEIDQAELQQQAEERPAAAEAAEKSMAEQKAEEPAPRIRRSVRGQIRRRKSRHKPRTVAIALPVIAIGRRRTLDRRGAPRCRGERRRL